MSAATNLRFYLNENLPVEIARQLQSRDIDVVTVHDLDLLGDEDVNHLVRASKLGRVLCTYDTDCVNLASTGIQHAGVTAQSRAVLPPPEQLPYIIVPDARPCYIPVLLAFRRASSGQPQGSLGHSADYFPARRLY